MKAYATPVRPSLVRSPRRLLLAATGLVCLGLALVGIVVPGLPTTVFLIAASYLFTRSCPVLEEKLLRSRPFRPYLRYLDGNQPIPRRARLSALALMWIAVSISLLTLGARHQLRPWLGTLVVGAAAAGSVVITTYRSGRR